MDVVSSQLEKARIYAYFGFAGLMLPAIGIITACISISILDRLNIENDEDAAEEKERIRAIANNTIVLSAIVAIIMTVLLIIAYTQLSEAIGAQNQASQKLQEILSPIDE